ncbi:hypothetical protein SCHPADRAFT_889676 [Schizopora paradoxa]|uniref:Uncharacterized protein n=1 Tax=Schizopora paradoxa TaxID=27342 RepID=A0A0H2RPH4_9AGAM|nr:hypothetical protein SCHPADRAFT_889676 [Schizopora paradoxa]
MLAIRVPSDVQEREETEVDGPYATRGTSTETGRRGGRSRAAPDMVRRIPNPAGCPRTVLPSPPPLARCHRASSSLLINNINIPTLLLATTIPITNADSNCCRRRREDGRCGGQRMKGRKGKGRDELGRWWTTDDGWDKVRNAFSNLEPERITAVNASSRRLGATSNEHRASPTKAKASKVEWNDIDKHPRRTIHSFDTYGPMAIRWTSSAEEEVYSDSDMLTRIRNLGTHTVWLRDSRVRG